MHTLQEQASDVRAFCVCLRICVVSCVCVIYSICYHKKHNREIDVRGVCLHIARAPLPHVPAAALTASRCEHTRGRAPRRDPHHRVRSAASSSPTQPSTSTPRCTGAEHFQYTLRGCTHITHTSPPPLLLSRRPPPRHVGLHTAPRDRLPRRLHRIRLILQRPAHLSNSPAHTCSTAPTLHCIHCTARPPHCAAAAFLTSPMVK